MKKYLTAFIVCMVIMLSFCYNTYAQTGKTITLSVSGIEFDDPNFTALRDNLKASQKAKNLQPTYNAGTAKISLVYNGSPTDLWDDLPASIKQPFKLSSVDANSIALKLKSVSAENDTDTKTITTTTAKSNEGCTTCYIDLCKYDGIKTFQGIAWYGINYDDGTYYYRCENGMLLRKTIIVNGNNVTTNIITDTILYMNKPIGYSWGWRKEDSKDYAMDMRTIIAKGVTVQIDGKTYNDVIVVNRKNANSNNAMRFNDVLQKMIAKESGTNINAYYIRGTSAAIVQQLEIDADPLMGLQQYRTGNTGNTVSTEPTGTVQPVKLVEPSVPMKGKVDLSLVGLWRFTMDGVDPLYMKLNADGTSEFKSGINADKGFWRVDGNFIELVIVRNSKPELSRQAIEKTIEAGKPVLIKSGDKWKSADNKKSW